MITNGAISNIAMIYDSLLNIFLFVVTRHTLLKTLSTESIIHTTIHAKRSPLIAPIPPPSVLSMIFLAALMTKSIICLLFSKYPYRSSCSLSARPRPPVIAKTIAIKGTTDIVLKKLRATA